ncbi:MAG: hypothetical protein K2P69_12215 [Eubacterium sp.]|nr:hypothetical protein [Eubacterium sp.]
MKFINADYIESGGCIACYRLMFLKVMKMFRRLRHMLKMALFTSHTMICAEAHLLRWQQLHQPVLLRWLQL